jgi:integrase
VPPTTRDRFSAEEIKKLWAHKDEPWVDTVLILIYSGWRISEFLGIKASDVDLAAKTMKGGVKTDAGKDRVVPIHSLIKGLVKRRLDEGGEYLVCLDGKRMSPGAYCGKVWRPLTERLGIDKVPHECRHTFESLLDGAGANRRCIDLMMGHVSKDTGNRVYNHKTLEELKFNIELVTRQ